MMEILQAVGLETEAKRKHKIVSLYKFPLFTCFILYSSNEIKTRL